MKIVQMPEGDFDLARFFGARRHVQRRTELGADRIEVVAVHPERSARVGTRPPAKVAED
ncbi:MAG: hypothetical protein ABI318_14845 [Chthoniobacteraceae bacterium]